MLGAIAPMIGSAVIVVAALVAFDWETCKTVAKFSSPVDPTEPLPSLVFDTECAHLVREVSDAAKLFGGIVGAALGGFIGLIIGEINQRRRL